MEEYLLQLVYLVLQRPSTSLERVLIDLCARSLRIAAKVRPSWPVACVGTIGRTSR